MTLLLYNMSCPCGQRKVCKIRTREKPSPPWRRLQLLGYQKEAAAVESHKKDTHALSAFTLQRANSTFI